MYRDGWQQSWLRSEKVCPWDGACMNFLICPVKSYRCMSYGETHPKNEVKRI